ncbi:MAG: Tat pathway signal protein [Bacteroidetes bacterium GWF2_42_66]|nr:MAG: Tat pathway signal protein [Bacteroidetes bacterium GWA2_42_15]OFX98099.1 MAG: Tat pathway signal protein [Bacteroidetes bacterium GWE2_42_39]OFY42483.1 MAG: Tat pathway signal protein [Bacteroidetes bacterium GWF2_42_66]HBL74196.1 Tat pathway signal protein [Prolixibacteraceae bacterium]HCR91681.1 Tat pathway signal protein [Prolixibacteraceae bacterium]
MEKKENNTKIWGCLLHLSFNMWEDYISPHRPFRGFRPYLELSEPLWNDAINKMAKEEMNMVVIDLGDAVRYESHPEIAVNHAWSTDRLKTELDRIRSLGMEPIPKLNFSAGHDTWMGEYSRMVSTEEYYKFCTDIIKEVCTLFDTPRFFHLGMDEESMGHQSYQSHVIIRKNEAWWKDFIFLVGEVDKNNSRAWIWPDYMLWNEADQFFKKMPKSVVQSNWYYGENFDLGQMNENEQKYVKSYIDLEIHGYDQIPTGSYHADNEKSISNTVQFCKKHINDSRLLGFLQSFWKPTIEEHRERILKGIELMGDAKQWFEKNS